MASEGGFSINLMKCKCQAMILMIAKMKSFYPSALAGMSALLILNKNTIMQLCALNPGHSSIDSRYLYSEISGLGRT